MSSEQITYVDPERIYAGANTRFNLKQSRIDSLAADILDKGGILSPVEARTYGGDGDFDVDLTSGFYRVAAAMKLKGDGSTIQVPVIIRDVDEPTRLFHQLAENMERENQSPMDIAIAIKALMDAGVERKEIRRLFARPTGRKGAVAAPASNAWVNIMLGLLELPKAMQARVHDGNIGVEAAYHLGRVPADKRQAVLDRIDKERAAQVEAEEKDEAKFLKAEAEVTEYSEKLTTTDTEAADLRAAIEGAEKAAKEQTAEFKRLSKVNYLEMSKDDQKVHREKLSGAEASVKAANKLLKDSRNKLADLLTKRNKTEEALKDAKDKLDAARSAKSAAAKSKAKTVSPADVQKAAAAIGASSSYVPLNAGEMRAVVKELFEEAGHPGVASIGKVLGRIFSGELTTKEGIALLTKLAPKSLKDVGIVDTPVEPKAEETPKTGGAGKGQGTKKKK